MTFNARYDEPADGVNSWANRRDLVIATIRSHRPDLLGLQEPNAYQWADIVGALPDYASFGAVYDENADGELDPQGGFVRVERFDVVEGGVFWLSDTPQLAGSVSWPNDWGPRACGWVRLHDRVSARALVFASTHFDTNAEGWLPSAHVLHVELDRIADHAAVIVAGDFNCAAGSQAHTYLCTAARYRDAWTEAGHSDSGVVTFNGFTNCTELPRDAVALASWMDQTSDGIDRFTHYPSHVRAHGNYRIDWILLRGSLRCRSALIDYRKVGGRVPSDHYPVVAEIEWQ